MTPGAAAWLIGLGVLLAATAWTLADAWQARARGSAAWVALTLALAAAAVAVHGHVVPATFLHSNLHGPALLDAVLAFPEAPTMRPEYGRAGFLALGAAARFLGGDFEAVVLANRIALACTLAVVGWLASRWTGRPGAAPIAVLVGIGVPGLARVAASEDVHTVATLAACLALLHLDRWAMPTSDGGRRWPALLAAGGWGVWALLSRQTLYPWLALFVAVPVLMRDRTLVRDVRFLAVAGLLVAVTSVRILATVLHTNDRVTVDLLPQLLARPAMLVPALDVHPLVDLSQAAILTPLALAGLAWLAWARRGGWVLAAVFFGIAVLTWPLGVPTEGDALGFRQPLLVLAVLAAAVALARLPPVAGTLAAALLVGAAAALPGWHAVQAVSPLVAEREFLKVALRSMPKGALLAKLVPHEPMPSYGPPLDLLRAADVRLVPLRDLQPAEYAAGKVWFLAGVQCRAWSLAERWQVADPVAHEQAGVLGLLAAAYGRVLPAGVEDTGEERPECKALRAVAAEAIAVRNVPAPGPELPFVMYGRAPIAMALWRLRNAPAGLTP